MATKITAKISCEEFDRVRTEADADHKLLHGNGEPGLKSDLLVVKTRVDLMLLLLVPIAISAAATIIKLFAEK
jgi:hypothetical protein